MIALWCLATGFTPLQAADVNPDADRGISVFDRYPECMKPDDMPVAERKKCEIQNGPPRRPLPARKPATDNKGGESIGSGGAPEPSGSPPAASPGVAGTAGAASARGR